MTELVDVTKQEYIDFLRYTDKHVKGSYYIAHPIADCTNLYNAADEVIGTRSIWETYKIRADVYELFIKCPEDQRYPKKVVLNQAEYNDLIKDLTTKEGTGLMVEKLREEGIEPLDKMTCKVDYDKKTYTIIEG